MTSRVPSEPSASRLISPLALMAIQDLELRARVVVEGFWHGLHRSPYHGFSVEFTEYRPYVAGDDPRYLDWRLFARSDRFYIKKFEDETNLRCHLLVDRSRSMDYGSTGYTKSAYANTLAATLAYFLHQQGDAVGLLTFDGGIRDYLPARHRMGHLRRIMVHLEQATAGTATDLVGPLQRIVSIVRKRSLMVLISDFLAPIEALERSLTPLAAAGHEVILLQVLDPVELTFDFKQPVVFQDAESGRDLFIDPITARAGYLKRFQSHQESVLATCRRLGAGFRSCTSDRPLELAMFDFLRERMQRPKSGRRMAGRSA
jgi:uncharacterized protein (DUF58 family)